MKLSSWAIIPVAIPAFICASNEVTRNRFGLFAICLLSLVSSSIVITSGIAGLTRLCYGARCRVDTFANWIATTLRTVIETNIVTMFVHPVTIRSIISAATAATIAIAHIFVVAEKFDQ